VIIIIIDAERNLLIDKKRKFVKNLPNKFKLSLCHSFFRYIPNKKNRFCQKLVYHENVPIFITFSCFLGLLLKVLYFDPPEHHKDPIATCEFSRLLT